MYSSIVRSEGGVEWERNMCVCVMAGKKMIIANFLMYMVYLLYSELFSWCFNFMVSVY